MKGPYAAFGEESLQWSIDTSVAPINQISVVAAEKSLILVIPKKEFVRKLPSEVYCQWAMAVRFVRSDVISTGDPRAGGALQEQSEST